jgi:hypothetical protein
MELSCAVREFGARAPWTGGVMSLTQRSREPSSNEAPGRIGFEMYELERLGQQFGNEALYSDWKGFGGSILSRRLRTKGGSKRY